MRRLIITALTAFALGGGAGYGLAHWHLRHHPSPDAPTGAQENSGGAVVDMRVADGGVYRVRSVVDGDTVVLDNGLHVRYHGVNCPETGHFVKDAAPLSAEATARNIALVEGKQVRLKLAREPLDKYGRVVATLMVLDDNGPAVDVSRQLLQEGLGRLMTLGLNPQEQAELKECENQAKAAKAGLWGLEKQARADGAKPYCASSAGKVFHVSVCSVAAKILPANRHEYDTAEDAENAGLKPCSVCKPR
jgi:micrococcal nuclease